MMVSTLMSDRCIVFMTMSGQRMLCGGWLIAGARAQRNVIKMDL